MHNRVLRIAILLLLWVFFGTAVFQTGYAQDYTQGGYNQQRPAGYNTNPNMAGQFGNNNPLLGLNPNLYDDDQEGQVADTTQKPPKTRKPLESYLFDDSTRVRPNFAWNIDTYRNRITFVDIDTAMLHFQLDQPYKRKGVGDAMQGALGGATYALNYFDRANYTNFNFAQPYDTYFFYPSNVYFYNVKRPFTQFGYLTAGAKDRAEENLLMTHAQNISPSSGFHINYKSRGAKGMYAQQKQRAKNLSMGFSHTGKKYTVHAGYIYNADINNENGGLFSDADLTDSIFELSKNLQTWINKDARNTIKNNTFYAVQSYGIPLKKLTDEDFSIADRSSIFLGHSIEYSRWHKNYVDSKTGMFVDPDGGGTYYDNWFINPNGTHDSIFESLLANRLFIQLQPWDRDGVVGVIDAGVGMDNHLYYQFVPSQFLTGKGKGEKKTDYYVYGSIEGKVKRYVEWGGDVKMTPAGYRSGDMSIGGHLSISAFIKDNPITLSGKVRYDRRSADYWSQEFFSNHYFWTNSFDKENETRVDATLSMPSAGLEVGASYSIVNNKIYYGADRHPKQYSGNVNVTGVYARKDFRLGGFHLNHRVLLQWSTSQEVIPVPMASAYLSYFFEFNVVKDVLRMQFGVDGRYNTKYYAMGWNPATTTFYNQREKQIGGYPMLDVFVSAKWKRMRILLKMEHLNEDMIGRRNYFAIPHYPQNMRLFKLGFSWAFYD